MLFDVILGILTLISLFLIFKISRSKKYEFSIKLLIALGFALVSVLIMLITNSLSSGHGLNIFAHESFVALGSVVETSTMIKGLSFIASIFTSLMKVSVIPLVAFSILNLIIKKKEHNTSKVFAYGIVGFVSVVVISAIVGLSFAHIFDLGKGLNLSGITLDATMERLNTASETAKSYNLFDLLGSFLPTNIIDDMAQGKVIPVLIFVVLIGLSINRAKKRYGAQVEVVQSFTEAIYAAMTYFVRTILNILPYSIYAMLVNMLLASDFSSLTTLFTYVVVILLAMVTVLILMLVALQLNGINAINYIKTHYNPLFSAFFTASSSSTLPLSIETLRNNGVSEESATIIPTLGTTMGMAACGAIYPAVLTYMALNASGQEITIATLAMVVLVVLIGSFGMQGVPGTAMYAATLVLTTLNLPLAVIVLVATIDFFVDMFRTLTNVDGALTVATIVDKKIKKEEGKEVKVAN